MIALVIMEIHTLWLVKDSIISCYYHLMWIDLSKSAKFQSGCMPHILLVLLSVIKEMMNAIKKNSISKSTKDATKIGVSLSKTKIHVGIKWTC